MQYTEIISAQKKFFNTGKTKDYQFRLEALKNLRESLLYYENEINEALERDLNKSEYESFISEIGAILQELSHAIKNLKGWMKPKRRSVGVAAFPGYAYDIFEPYGTALIISPWNYPIMLTFTPLIGAIAAGNCCIVKPSELSPNTSLVIGKIISRAFSKEYITTVMGGKEETQALLEERFDYIFFTGSTEVGKYIMEKAAKHLTPVTLELGGKSPCIICEDANIKEAAKNIAFGKLLNSGQTCIAPDYVLICDKVKESFCREITNQFNTMVRDGLSNPVYPRIINERHFDRILGLLEEVKVFSGGRSNRETLKIEPTVLIDVGNDSPIMKEEIFGPLLPIISYSNLDEAIGFIKDREKPLAMYLFTKSKETEKVVFNDLSFGGGCVNDTISHIICDGLGFGGVGYSGMGLYHGIHSFMTFSHRKGIYKKSNLVDLHMRYHPYNKKVNKLLRFLMK